MAQAVSNFLADRTKLFHSYQIKVDGADLAQSIPYDGESLKSYIRNFITQENNFLSYFLEKNIAPINLFYEDIVARPQEAVLLLANVLGVKLPENYLDEIPENPIKKLGGKSNVALEEKFRMNEGEFIQEQFERRGKILEHSQTI
ncbi:Stf0 family sulfotransferase [Pseudophaeobacter leonis]|uniref:Stf0 family sulfotransferase n=1 Tax=Pseudophaeobacter leonis TaxID=1144477 RepID=UPI0013747A5E|nr:Stf0 family sulfotransferase [Pseudophaeobacter leonis]